MVVPLNPVGPLLDPLKLLNQVVGPCTNLDGRPAFRGQEDTAILVLTMKADHDMSYSDPLIPDNRGFLNQQFKLLHGESS